MRHYRAHYDVFVMKAAISSVGLNICRQHWFHSLRWRHNERDGVLNHQPHDCLLNLLFRRSSKKTSKLRVTGLCVGNSPWPVNSPHKGPVTRKMFPFDDVIMLSAVTHVNDIWDTGRHLSIRRPVNVFLIFNTANLCIYIVIYLPIWAIACFARQTGVAQTNPFSKSLSSSPIHDNSGPQCQWFPVKSRKTFPLK